MSRAVRLIGRSQAAARKRSNAFPPYTSDETVERVAKAIFAAYIGDPDWRWDHISFAYDREKAEYTARAAIEAHEAAKGEDDSMQRLARAAFVVDTKHHIRPNADGTPACLCGWVGDARARTQTEHITLAVIEEYDHD